MNAHDVREHGLHFELCQVELTRQCAHQGQGTRPQLPAGNPCWQGPVVFAAATATDATQAQVLTHNGFDIGQLEDLVAHGFVAIDFDI